MDQKDYLSNLSLNTRPLHDDVLGIAAEQSSLSWQRDIIQGVGKLRDWLLGDADFATLVPDIQDPELPNPPPGLHVADATARLASILCWPVIDDPLAQTILSTAWTAVTGSPVSDIQCLGTEHAVVLSAHQRLFRAFFRALRTLRPPVQEEGTIGFITPIAIEGRLPAVVLTRDRKIPEPTRPNWEDIVRMEHTIGDVVEAYVPSSFCHEQPTLVLMLTTVPRYGGAHVLYEPRWRQLAQRLHSWFDTRGRVLQFRKCLQDELLSDRGRKIPIKPSGTTLSSLAAELMAEYAIRDVSSVRGSGTRGLAVIADLLLRRHPITSVSIWTYDGFRGGSDPVAHAGSSVIPPVGVRLDAEQRLAAGGPSSHYCLAGNTIFVKAEPPIGRLVISATPAFALGGADSPVVRALLSDIGRLGAWLLAEPPTGDRFLDLDKVGDLNELLCCAIRYKSSNMSSDKELMDWMKRSRPTVYRMKEEVRRYFAQQVSADEAVGKMDLQQSVSRAVGKRE